MGKKKETSELLDRMNAAFEDAEHNYDYDERVDPESFEVGRDPRYPNTYKNTEQGRRMKRTIARLQKEEKENYPKIIEAQNELIQWYEDYLSESEKAFKELKAFYRAKYLERKNKQKEIERRLNAFEKQMAELAIEVNKNTQRLNDLVEELNEEKRRVGELARKACNDAVAGFNRILEERACSKFCYYKLCGLECIIKKFNEQNLSVDALYALAVDALGCLAEIESETEVEWKKFHPIYESFKGEVTKFLELLEKSKQIKLNEQDDLTIDVNFWTNDGFADLYEEVKLFGQRVKDGEYARDYVLSDVNLDKKSMNTLKKRLESLIGQAKTKAARAFHRQELALQSADCLRSQYDFSISICQFEESDQRRIFIVEACSSIYEMKITLLFIPDGHDDDEALCLIRHDHYIDPNEYDTIVADLISSLKNSCGVICNTNLAVNKGVMIGYEVETLTMDGKINETINNVITTSNSSRV